MNVTSPTLAKYLALDPDAKYFLQNNTTWSSTQEEPVHIVTLEGVQFEKLVGRRNSVPECIEYYPAKSLIQDMGVAMNICEPIAFTGHCGTGKSDFVRYMAGMLNRPLFVVDVHEDYRAETLFGEYKPTPNKTLEWKDGPVAEAFKTAGSIILLDEANFACPALLACLHTVLAGGDLSQHDRSGTNEQVKFKKAKGVMFTMACNALVDDGSIEGYNDVKEMNKAFLDRWSVVSKVTYLPEKVELNLVTSICSKKYPKEYRDSLSNRFTEKVKCVVKLANRLRTMLNEGHTSVVCSTRRTLSLSKMLLHSSCDITSTIHIGLLNRECLSDAKAIDIVCLEELSSIGYTSKFNEQ